MAIKEYDWIYPNHALSPEAFAIAIQKYIDWMISLPGQINATAAEILALADVSNYNPATIYNPTGYTKPSMVYGSGGMAYVCIGDNVQGDNPVGSITGAWVRITLKPEDIRLYPLASGVVLTGDILGLGYEKTGDHEVTFQPGHCFDSTNSVKLTLSAEQAVTALPNTADTGFHFFLCDDGVVRHDTDETGSNLTAYNRRWVGLAPNNAAGILYPVSTDRQGTNIQLGPVELGSLYAAAGVSVSADFNIASLVPVSRVTGVSCDVVDWAHFSTWYRDWNVSATLGGTVIWSASSSSGLSVSGFEPFSGDSITFDIVALGGNAVANTAKVRLLGVTIKR